MHKFVYLVFLMNLVLSCASSSRKITSESEVVIKGGVFNDLQWNDELRFKRYSWYNDASMEYDILITKLDTSSKFYNWIGNDKNLLKDCAEFYVALLYADIHAQSGVSFLRQQFEAKNFKALTLIAFRENLEAHHNFQDWRLQSYKIMGFCSSTKKGRKIEIHVPGHRPVLI